MGSVNGMPNSITSTPESAIIFIAVSVSFLDGSPHTK